MYKRQDYDNLPVVAVGGVVDIRESERVELDDFNPLFTDFLEVSFITVEELCLKLGRNGIVPILKSPQTLFII